MIQNHKRLQRKPSRKNRQYRTRSIAMEQLEDRRVLATFGVNTLLDSLDANPGDGLAEDASGQTSLRAAVMEANALGGANTIKLGSGTYALSIHGIVDEAFAASGDLDITSDLTIQGIDKTSTIIDGLQLGRIIDVFPNSSLNLKNVSLINGYSHSRGGGAIHTSGDLIISDSLFSDNASSYGGGAIHASSSDNLPAISVSITRSTFERNQAILGNGGAGAIQSHSVTSLNIIDSQFIENKGFQGAVYTRVDTTISGSLFQGNEGRSGGAISGFGGNLDITNSTFTSNYASYSGGAISRSYGHVSLTNVTIAHNQAKVGGGGVSISSSTSEITNSIIALNSAGSSGSTLHQDLLGLQNLGQTDKPFISSGGNLIGNVAGVTWDSSAPATDILGQQFSPIDPLLDALADNGGPTPTMALFLNSPAIDAGLLTGAPSVDQRGVARPQGLGIDIGAFEHVPNPSANAPTATGSLETTLEDTPLIGQMIGADDDGDTLNFSVITQPANGQVEWSSDGSYTYTPNQDTNGLDSFTFQVFTIDSESILATVDIDVTPVNDRPTASNMTFYPTEDASFNGQLVANDIDSPEPNYFQKSDPANGDLIFNKDGSITYTPDPDFDGIDTFTWSAVDDGNRGTGVKTAYLNVQGVNDPPIAIDGQETLTEDSSVIITLGSFDADGDVVELEIVSPSHGSILKTKTTLEPNQFLYIPNSNYFGTDQIKFWAFDPNTGGPLSEPAYFDLTITPINDAPVAATMGFMTDEETPFTNSLMAADVDNTQSELQFEIIDQPLHGTLVLSETVNGEITYTPTPDFFGEDTFTYKVNDGNKYSGIATGTIQVKNVNDAPVAETIYMGLTEDILFSNNVNATDADGDSLTFEVESKPSHGSLTLNPNGTFDYLPDPNYAGDDEFTYRAFDGNDYSEPASIFLNVNPVNDAPELADAVFAVDENTEPGTIIGTLTGSDVEDAAEELSYALVGGSGLNTLGVFSTTGEIYVHSNVVLDYETTSSYQLEVLVIDSELVYSTAIITINLNDLFWVDINIVPNDYTNTAKLDSSIKVAILSNPEFDAVNDLDAASLTFGKNGDESSLKLHKKHGTPQVTYSDVNGDGRLDAVVTFDMRLTGLELGDTTATLRGTLLSSGEEFEATDSILISEGKGGGGGGGGNNGNGGGKGGGPKNR